MPDSHTEKQKFAFSDFDLLENIGVGSYSFVNKAIHRPTGKVYALKIVEKCHIIRHDKVKYILQEKELLIRLSKCKYIIQMHGTFQDDHRLYFVLEYMPRGDLRSFLKSNPDLDFSTVRHIMRQLVLVVGELHKNYIIHRDLKPENILLDEDLNIRCIDFGSALDLLPILRPELPSSSSEDIASQIEARLSISLSSRVPEHSPPHSSQGSPKPSGNLRAHSFVGTAHYVPPELVQSTPIPIQYLFAMDWWSIGVLFYYLISHGETPFNASNDFLIFQKILKLEYSFPDTFSPSSCDLIRLLLKPNPEERMPKDVHSMSSFIQSQRFFTEEQ